MHSRSLNLSIRVVFAAVLLVCFAASSTEAFQYIRFPQHQQIQYVDPFYSSPFMYGSSGPSFVSPLHAHLARSPSVEHLLAQLNYLDQVEQLQRDHQMQMARMQQQMKEQQALVDRMLARVHAQQQPHLLHTQPQVQQTQQPRQNWFQTIAQQQQQLLQQQFPQLFGHSQQAAPQPTAVPQPKQPELVEQPKAQAAPQAEVSKPQEIKQNPQPQQQQQQQPQQSTYVLVRNADGSLAVKRVVSPAPQTKQEQPKSQQPTVQQAPAAEVKQVQQPAVETKRVQPEATIPVASPVVPAIAPTTEPAVPASAQTPSEPVVVDTDEEIVPELMVTTTPDYYDVRLTFPPISSEYIHAEIRANQLVLTGERHYEDKVVLRQEEVGRIGQYGFVRRKWKLPQGVDNIVDIQNVPAEFNQQTNTLTLRLFKTKSIEAGRVPADVIGPNTKTKAVGSTIYIPIKITGEPVKREKKILPPSNEELELLEDETLFQHVPAQSVVTETNQTQPIVAEDEISIAQTAAGAATLSV